MVGGRVADVKVDDNRPRWISDLGEKESGVVRRACSPTSRSTCIGRRGVKEVVLNLIFACMKIDGCVIHSRGFKTDIDGPEGGGKLDEASD